MLKKAGIIVAVAATGVLAVSSLAFADEESGNLRNDCAFGNAGGSPTSMAEGGNTLVSLVETVTSIAVDATTQTNTLNCNNLNIEDVLDQDSNNETKRVDKTMIEDSFNTED